MHGNYPMGNLLRHTRPTDHCQQGQDTKDNDDTRFRDSKTVQPVDLVIQVSDLLALSLCRLQAITSKNDDKDYKDGDSQSKSDDLSPLITVHCDTFY